MVKYQCEHRVVSILIELFSGYQISDAKKIKCFIKNGPHQIHKMKQKNQVKSYGENLVRKMRILQKQTQFFEKLEESKIREKNKNSWFFQSKLPLICIYVEFENREK